MKNKFFDTLKAQIKKGIWTGYVTYYPHKKAYRPLGKLDMRCVWQDAKQIGIYVHIPFCNQKCSYCNLFSTVLPEEKKQDMYDKYVKKLTSEIDYFCAFLPNVKVLSVYFGGGTPNVLSSKQIGLLLGEIKQKFPNWDTDIEPCMECYPDMITKEYLQDIFEAGIRRISVGVQSFVPKELEKIGRAGSEKKISQIRLWAGEIGINTNFDLIYGLPYQTKRTFLESLGKLIQISPESICTYPLAIRPHTIMEKVSKKLIFSTKQKFKFFAIVAKKLKKVGYKCQTIVRFVKSKSTCQMEHYEYLGVPTLGLGAGARSYSNTFAYSISYKVQDVFVRQIIEEYMITDVVERQFDGYQMQAQDYKIKFVMLNLLEVGVSKEEYKQKFSSDVMSDFNSEWQALKKLKLIKEKNGIINLTTKGMQYCDLVADIFVPNYVKDLYKSYVAE